MKSMISSLNSSNNHSNNNSKDNINVPVIENSSNINNYLEDLLKRMNDLEQKLDSKLDCDVFDNEIASLRALIGEIDNDDKNKL